jgi:hypothetical protein
MKRVGSAILLIATLTVAGIAPATAASRHHRRHHHGGGGSTSGVRGVVTAGPVCPVERIPPDPNCADRPVVARVLVTRGSGGGVVASGASGSDGSFEISVAPGHYEVTATTKFAMRCDSVPVVVVAGGFTDVTVPCDTGIR